MSTISKAKLLSSATRFAPSLSSSSLESSSLVALNLKENPHNPAMSPSNYWHARKLLATRRSNNNKNKILKFNANNEILGSDDTTTTNTNNNNGNLKQKNHNNGKRKSLISTSNHEPFLTTISSNQDNCDCDLELNEKDQQQHHNENAHVIAIPTAHVAENGKATNTQNSRRASLIVSDETTSYNMNKKMTMMMMQNHDQSANFSLELEHQQQQQHHIDDEQRERLDEEQQSPQTARGGEPSAGANAVVGVGGTVTTVTRGHRKTAPLPRLVAKNGTVNLFLDNIDRRQYMRDLFTTMIDIKWRYNLAAAALGFVISWLFFAIIWYIVLYLHGDLEHENEPTWSPCIVNVNSFSSALLFSIETQSTLGFGSRIISVECPSAIVIFCAQLIFGVVIECLIVGMVFAKLSRPAKRSQTIMFSKMATISLREGRLCLIFRVGDVRSKSHIIGATIRVSLVSHKVTLEGEVIPFYHHQLDAKIDESRNNLLLIWPVLVVHEINESSPLFQLNAKQLAEFKFEIITVLEGTIESTGQSIQVRSSYLPSEVKWGYRFEQIVSTHGFGRYAQTIIDYNKFNKVSEVPEMPQCSSAEYEATKKLMSRVAAAKKLALDVADKHEFEPNNNDTTSFNHNHNKSIN